MKLRTLKNFFYRIILAAFFALVMTAYSPAYVRAAIATEPDSFLKATFEQTEALFGDTVTLRVEYKLPLGAQFAGKDQLKGLEGLAIIDIERKAGNFFIQLMADQSGVMTIKNISLEYTDKDGQKLALTTPPVTINVASTLGEKPEEAELKPIEDIVPTTPLIIKLLPYLAGAAGVLLIAGLVIWFIRRRRRKKLFPEKVAPHVRAMELIEELESEKLFESGRVKDYFFKFSGILRRYLEEIRGFPAAEYTTQEIALAVTEAGDHDLLPLLKNADMAKFADHIPSQSRKEEEVQKAISYIKQTSPADDAAEQPLNQKGKLP